MLVISRMANISNEKSKFVNKTISITEEQECYILDKCINLSRLVQKTLRELMKK